jgi:heavy metal sensor kinase
VKPFEFLRRPLTLRTRLTLLYAGVLALLFTTLGFAYYHAFARQLDIDAATTLSEITSGVHGYLTFDNGLPVLDYDRADPAQVTFVEEATRYYQVYDVKTGQLLVQSPALEPLGVQYTPDEVRAFASHPRVQEVQTDQRRIRFSNSVISPGDGGLYLLQVGVPLDPMTEALDRFLRLLLWSVPAGILAAALTSRWIAGRALVPLARLAEATRTIEVADLRRRVPVRGAGDELDQVAHAFNDALGRLEYAVNEMRQFSTAIAHELRTPLAALRGETELALIQARSPEEYRRGLESHLEALDRLARLITELLTLARAEAGDIPLAREPVDLAALCGTVVEQLEPVAQARGITLMCQASGEVTVIGDRGWIERLLLNLLDNALKFTPENGRIAVRVTRNLDVVTLAVEDSGTGIEPGLLARLFERFARTGSVLPGQTAGVGLGLRLVKWIADRHGVTIAVASEVGAGTTFTLKFPGRA